MNIDQLQGLLWSFARHRVITVAGRLGIIRLLSERARSEGEVAGELGLDALATGKMLRALAALGLLTSGDGVYRVVDELAPHFRGGPGDFSAFLEHSHHLYESWGANLEQWVRGEPWTTMRRDREGTRRFGEAMQAMGGVVSGQVVAALDLNGVTKMLDVGGGFGAYARTYCRAKGDLRAVVLDTETVAELGREAVAREGLSDRIGFIGGDYLETEYGSGYDLVQIANVLHQESEERAAVLVQRGADALAPGGRLVVLDFSIDEGQSESAMGALFAINMRSFGDTYTESTISGWMAEAGLADVERRDISALRWLIIGRKAA